jgi:NAD-dependent DNA ligase
LSIFLLFRKNYKYIPRTRVLPKSSESAVTGGDSSLSLAHDAADSRKPLSGMQFVIIGKTTEKRSDVVEKIMELGGKIAASVDGSVSACVSSQGMFHLACKI